MKSKRELREQIKVLTNKADGLRATIKPFLEGLEDFEYELFDLKKELAGMRQYDRNALVRVRVWCPERCCVSRRAIGRLIDMRESMYHTVFVVREVFADGTVDDHRVLESDVEVLELPEE